MFCGKFKLGNNANAKKFLCISRIMTHQFSLIFLWTAAGTIIAEYYWGKNEVDITDLNPGKLWFWMCMLMVASALGAHYFIYLLAATIDDAISLEFRR